MRLNPRIALLVFVACASDDSFDNRPAVAAKRVFVGNIRTMDANSTNVEAIAVDARGLIVARGTKADVLAQTSDSKPDVVSLDPSQAMLPGFIEPHMHLPATIQVKSGVFFTMNACLPAAYAEPGAVCYRTIADAEKALLARDTGEDLRWHLGLDLDPSRQPYDATTTSDMFRLKPAEYLARDISSTRPTVLLDQSGHVAYANLAAFDELEALAHAAGKPWPPTYTAGGALVLSSDTPTADGNKKFSGRILEQEAYLPFLAAASLSYGASAVQFGDLVGHVNRKGAGVPETMRALRSAGVTTIVGIADTEAFVNASRAFANLPEAPVRVSSLTFPEVAKSVYHSRPVPPACDPRASTACALPRDLGVTGIKITVDGSTQGCSAGLMAPVTYLPNGFCQGSEGHLNYTADVLHDTLVDLWGTGLWRFETHTNGNGTMQLVTDVYARLQSEKPNPHPAVLIHATVGDENVWRNIAAVRAGTYTVSGKTPAALDLRVTHLIGHVPFWGTAFQNQLGPDAAANIDPTGWDNVYGVPFTLHSDSTITEIHPLFFVRQAVLRETWTYPDLREDQKQVLGPAHKISVEDALRAITIRGAAEKELDPWLGSLEIGKVADLVVLSRDPLGAAVLADPTQLSAISVIDTYLGGEKTASP